jgi:uncharacterized damage-inducible protein DinB
MASDSVDTTETIERKITEIFSDSFGRIQEVVHEVVDGLTQEQLGFRPDGESNSIAWLVWHLARVQDDHIAGAADTEQVWLTEGWEERFGLPLEPTATGYAHNADEVAAVAVESAELLTGYYDAVHAATLRFVDGLKVADLDRVVDYRWTPPVTLGVRLVSVIGDDLQHAGQAAYLRGMITRSP